MTGTASPNLPSYQASDLQLTSLPCDSLVSDLSDELVVEIGSNDAERWVLSSQRFARVRFERNAYIENLLYEA